jgi:beta-glucanase (GH16 family)
MNRRNAMLTLGIGALAAAVPTPQASATPLVPAPAAPAPGAQTGGFLFHDEFDGPAGPAPDPSKWVISSNRTPIRNPVGFDRPEFWGQYRNDQENVFVDGKSNLVLRATKDGDKFFGG